jgi:hypothetical protein
MNPKIAATLSIVGVLAAGSAAAAVNTNILDSGPNESTASAAVAPLAGSVDMSVPEPGATSTTSLATTTVPSSSTTVATTPSLADPATAPAITTFNVGDAGVVTVELADGALSLVSVVPTDGWVVAAPEDPQGDDSQGDDSLGDHGQGDDGQGDESVQVAFESATVRVEFEAHVVDGKIVPSVESKSLVRPAATSEVETTRAPAPAPAVPATAAPAPSMPVTTAGHEDHEREDHGDDSHESEHEDQHDTSGQSSSGGTGTSSEPRERDDD